MSDFETVKASVNLKEYAEQHLQKSAGGLYCCPACGSGTHGGRNSDGALGVYDNGTKWKCQSCGAGGDVFDLAGILNDTEEKTEQLQIVADWAGVAVDRGGVAPSGSPRGFQETMNARAAATETPQRAQSADKGEGGTDTPENEYAVGRERHRRYIAECAERLRETPETDTTRRKVIDYLTARGITEAEAETLGIGYDPNYKGRGKPRIILPWAGSDYYHIDRALEDVPGKYSKPPSYPDEDKGITPDMCVGAQPLYNPAAFDQDYIVVVEGALDAIAVQLCGYNAVALGGTASNQFATEAAERNYSGVVIDMLDCDGNPDEPNKGRGAGMKLVSLLGEAGITTLQRLEYGITNDDDYGGHKDAGEWFAADRADLADMLEVMAGIAREKAKTAKEAQYREAMRNLNVKDPARVARDVLELRDVYEPVPTGIASLDDALGGGVSLGETTFFGAVSSYGKTTLAVQIADYMASRGRSVLFVTIEQSAKELIAKSLSRLIYTENETGWNVSTPQEITSLRTRKAWGEGQRGTLSKAVEDYNRMIAPHMRILEGNRQPTVGDVRAVASVMAEHDGQAPIVFIDYLQLLAPLSERYDTDKRNADMNVSELRKMARDLKTHVWCISSLNRSSYSGVISLDSFKESGGIEYGADNLLGLQPRNMAGQLEGIADSKMKREADKLIRENKKKTERDCELVVLKQRNGALPDEPLPLTFKPMSAYFIEPGSAARQAQARTKTVL